jgi:hypothetical protein
MALQDGQAGVYSHLLRAPFPAQPGPINLAGGQVLLRSLRHRAVIGLLHGQLQEDLLRRPVILTPPQDVGPLPEKRLP